MAEEKDKMSSRKFLVWGTWLFITIVILVVCVIAICVSKEMDDKLTGLIEKIISSFFYVSMMYLGVNAGQKMAFAVGDAIAGKKEDE